MQFTSEGLAGETGLFCACDIRVMEIISDHELLSPHRSEPHLDVGDDQMADRGSDSTRGYTSEEDSEEWEEDNEVVCEDWTLENDALGHLFDPDDCRCDRPLDMPGTLSMYQNNQRRLIW